MDVEQLLKELRVPYITEGKNVKRGNINIHCPWCGSEDTSFHLGIELSTGRFGCWRNTQHRGRTLVGLLRKLTGCSYEVAVGLITRTSDLEQVVARLTASKTPSDDPDEESLVSDIEGLRPLTLEPKDARFRDYLVSRGYDEMYHSLLIDWYGLHCAKHGLFANRIVFPVIVNNEVRGYTGRCIDNGRLRYLSEPGVAVKSTVLWYDSILSTAGKTLYLCEGPFDALRLDFVACMNSHSARATCFFGVAPTHKQLQAVRILSEHYESVVVLFDRDTVSQSLTVLRVLGSSKARIKMLPSGVKDPGELTWAQTRQLFID